MHLDSLPHRLQLHRQLAMLQGKHHSIVQDRAGCVLCHSSTFSTAQSFFTGMSYVQDQAFSDFALQHMGENLADGISQGQAEGDEVRTAPLWGIVPA